MASVAIQRLPLGLKQSTIDSMTIQKLRTKLKRERKEKKLALQREALNKLPTKTCNVCKYNYTYGSCAMDFNSDICKVCMIEKTQVCACCVEHLESGTYDRLYAKDAAKVETCSRCPRSLCNLHTIYLLDQDGNELPCCNMGGCSI